MPGRASCLLTRDGLNDLIPLGVAFIEPFQTARQQTELVVLQKYVPLLVSPFIVLAGSSCRQSEETGNESLQIMYGSTHTH